MFHPNYSHTPAEMVASVPQHPQATKGLNQEDTNGYNVTVAIQEMLQEAYANLPEEGWAYFLSVVMDAGALAYAFEHGVPDATRNCLGGYLSVQDGVLYEGEYGTPSGEQLANIREALAQIVLKNPA